MAENANMTFEILEGDVMSPVRIAINGEEQELNMDVWNKALQVLESEMGLIYEDDPEAFVQAVFELYVQAVMETIDDAASAEEVIETGQVKSTVNGGNTEME